MYERLITLPIFHPEIIMRLIQTTALLAGLVLGGGIAGANAGTYTYSAYSFSGSNVQISDATLNVNIYGGSGLITLYGSGGSPNMDVYCVDIGDWLVQPGTMNYGVNPSTNSNLTGVSSITGDAKIADIGALILHGQNVAAVQLAIWETEYGAAASFKPDDLGLQAVVDTYLNEAKLNWRVPANLALYELTPADPLMNQTLVYVAPLPEPGTLALLGGGAFLTALLTRLRRPSVCAVAA
jgi:hypothetical protein